MSRTGRTSRGAIAAILAAVVALSTVADVAAVASFFPNQSTGNRGSDVRALQELLIGRGRDAGVTGVFDTRTRTAVRTQQSAVGLPVTGIVDAATWKSLIRTLKKGNRGPAVRAAQRLLKEKHRAKLAVDGVYGESTRLAVAAFQRHFTVTVTGTMTTATWRRLLWHYELPTWSKGLCDYSVGNGLANWGTGAAIGQLEAAAGRAAAGGYGKLAVGDISHEHGGDIAGHVSHEQGLDVDLRPIRKARNQCRYGTNYRSTSYDRAATREVIKHIRATAAGHIKLIYFNDPVLIKEGLTTHYSGHDDHIHIRYCEAWHPLSVYRC